MTGELPDKPPRAPDWRDRRAAFIKAKEALDAAAHDGGDYGQRVAEYDAARAAWRQARGYSAHNYEGREQRRLEKLHRQGKRGVWET